MWCIYLIMSDSPIRDFDQDHVIITTEVTVGKSYSSRGWALSRTDIHDWVPAEEFERDCKVIIDDISSEAVLRFNPRLFYESDELSSYLKELYDNGYSRYKVPMEILIPKNNFFTNVDSIEEYLNIGAVDTELLVGKSFSSKGWQLSKDVVEKLFPVEAYNREYLINIDNIYSNAKLNLQFRLFYKSNELSNYLEELHNINPRDKIPAKIIFNDDWDSKEDVKISEENSEVVNKNIDDDFDSPDNVNVQEDDATSVQVDIDKDVVNRNLCKICGQLYSTNESSSDKRFSDLCPCCVEKILALEAYNKIKESSLSNFIKKEFIEDKFASNFNQIWDLLLKYDFLATFGELYKLNCNESINQHYSKYLPDNPDINISSKKRNRDKILELMGKEEETEDENVCIVCGKTLSSDEYEKCESCSDKQLATEYLHDIVDLVPYGVNFSKLEFMGSNMGSLNAELVLNKLVQYELLLFDGNLFYRFNEVNFLNDFIKKYSENPYVIQVNYESADSNIPKISKNDLSSEERIDSLIKWKNYGDYVSFKKGQYGFTSVQFKQDGAFLYSKGFGTSYEAKIEAINYLKSLGKLILVDSSEIKLQIK